MDIDRSKPVLVTGGSGYIASWLVKYLLEDGINVHATVRDQSRSEKVQHLLDAARNAPGKLTLFDADLMKEGSFDEAMQGCELVFHTASPFVVRGIRDPQAELVEPALAGTRNVLEAANRTESVKRVVLTSSVAAIYGDAADLRQVSGQRFTEAEWNFSSNLDHQPYSYSKTVAEREAWKICEAQQRWDLVAVNPGFVMGPSLTANSDSESLSTLRDLVSGKLRTGVPDLSFGMVDVRDVAIAHMRAGFTAQARGRHILVGDTASLLDIARMLRKRFGDAYPFPRNTIPKWLVWLVGPFQGISQKFVSRNVGHRLVFDNSRACNELSMQFRSVEETVCDHFQQMLDDGLIRKRG